MRAYLLKLRLVGQSGGYARLNSPGSWDGTPIDEEDVDFGGLAGDVTQCERRA